MQIVASAYNIEELGVDRFRILSYLSYVGTPRQQYVYDYSDAYCQYFGVSKDDYVVELGELRSCGLVDESDVVRPWLSMRVILDTLRWHAEWRGDFGIICKYHDNVARYLWRIADFIVNGDVAAAARVTQPLVGLSGGKLNVYRYLQAVVGENPSLLSLVPREDMCEMMADVNYELFAEGRLDEETLCQQMAAVEIGQVDHEVLDMLSFYRYLVDGTKVKSSSSVTVWSVVSEAIAMLYADDIEGSLALFGKGLSLQRKSSARKKVYFEHCPFINYFYGMAMLRWKRQNPSSVCPQYHDFIQSGEVKLNYELFHIRLICNYAEVSGQNMQSVVGKNVLTAIENSDTLIRRCMGYLTMRYFDVPVDDSENRVDVPGSAILRHEMSLYLPLSIKEKDELVKVYGGVPLLSRLRRKAPWEVLLGDISYSVSHYDNEDKEDVASHIYYFLDGMELNAVVRMHELPDGRLISDEIIPRKQFVSMEFKSADEYDVKVATALATKAGELSDAVVIVPHLIRCDRVFVGRYFDNFFSKDGYVRATIVTESPYVEFSAKGDAINVMTNVDTSSSVTLRNTVTQTDDGVYHVVSTNPLQRDIISKFCTIPHFPSSAILAIRNTVSGLRGIIDIKENIMSPDVSTAVKGDSRISIRISPDGYDYHFSIGVSPSERGTMRFLPGVGEEVVYDEVDGLTQSVIRDLVHEYDNYKSLNDFLLRGGIVEFDDDYSGTIYTTSSALAILSFVYENQDRYYVEWPEGQLLRFRGSVGEGDVHIVVKSETKWFELDGRATVVGESVSLQELLKMYNKTDERGFVRLDDGEYIRMSDTLRRHLEMLESLPSISSSRCRVPVFQLGALAKIVDKLKYNVDDAYTEMLQRMKTAYTATYDVPEGVNATLRPYQIQGYEWLRRLDAWGAGACLADDMGLGKTLQSLTFILSKAADGPSLIVAPKSVVPNWMVEAARFTPSLRVVVVNDASDRRAVVSGAGSYDLLLCTYGVLTTEVETLSSRQWNVLCLDEAQQIKNYSTRVSKSAMKLDAKSRVALTGTPLQNHLGELWTLFQFINPGLLGPWKRFYNNFIRPEMNPDILAMLKDLTLPFILRRTKESVLDELPEKLVDVYHVEMSSEEEDIYEAMRRDAEIKFKEEKTSDERAKSKKLDLQFFDELTKLRLAACSMQLVHTHCNIKSSKISALVDMLKLLRENNANNVLVFSQFTSFLSLVKLELDKLDFDYLYLDGQTSIEQRRKSIDAFQSGEKRLFLLSLKAGGLGVNLTAANYVIILDPWWNPSIENQAMDRAHRIGQKRCVSVIRMVTRNTIEEKILRLHDKKRLLSDNVLDGTSESYSLSYEDILDMVSPF